jgi:hypothetical protein
MTSSLEQSPPSGDLADEASALEQQFDVVKLDYERTVALIDSVVRTRMALRALVAAAYLTLLGLAIEQRSPVLAVSAAVGTLLAGLNDAYLGWIYREALRRANGLERLFQHRMRALDRAYDPYPAQRMRMELERYEFGVYATFPRFRVALLKASIAWSTVASYLALLVVAIVTALLV